MVTWAKTISEHKSRQSRRGGLGSLCASPRRAGLAVQNGVAEESAESAQSVDETVSVASVNSVAASVIPTNYLYLGNQVMEEERNLFGGTGSTDTPIRQYVWGTYIDELIQLNTLVPLGPQNLPPGTYYLLQDLLYRAVALTNSSGAIVEAYDTDAYAQTIIYTGPGSDGIWFTDDDVGSGFTYGANDMIFCGYRYDPETRLYFVRNRMFLTDSGGISVGRWLQRDPIGYSGGINLYEYVGGRANRAADATGTDCPGCDGVPLFLQNPAAGGGQCTLQACASHDQCYYLNKCTAASWGHTLMVSDCKTYNPFCTMQYTPCDMCNLIVQKAILDCAWGRAKAAPGDPLYFCAKTGKFITIGPNGDYTSLASAKKCCCTG
jgi:RHS repeat-associated protein